MMAHITHGACVVRGRDVVGELAMMYQVDRLKTDVVTDWWMMDNGQWTKTMDNG